MKRTIAALVAALLASIGLTLITAAPAAASFSECVTSQAVCLFDGDNGGDPLLIYFTDIRSGACLNLPPSVNDRTNSAVSFRPSNVTFYGNINCSGAFATLTPNHSVTFGIINKNVASSIFVAPF